MALPLIRSGDLFANYTDDECAAYFDAVAAADSDDVLPEHVFGTNGWRNRLLATGADPVLAELAFRDEWDATSPEDRREQIEGNAIVRRYGNVEDSVRIQVGDAAAYAAETVSQAFPDYAAAVIGDPVALSELVQSELLGTNPMEV